MQLLRARLLAVWIVLAFAAPAFGQAKLVQIEGQHFVAPDGGELRIKGINLGNWLMPEGYMFKFEVAKAPHQIFGAFARLLGAARADSFWAEFHERYVTEDDIRFIKSAGFNVVRVPLHYRLFMDDSGTMAGPGWALLDRVVGWA